MRPGVHWSSTRSTSTGTLTLNGNNLFDKKYYQTVGTSTYGNYYGDPRNFMLTLRGTY